MNKVLMNCEIDIMNAFIKLGKLIETWGIVSQLLVLIKFLYLFPINKIKITNLFSYNFFTVLYFSFIHFLISLYMFIQIVNI